MKQSKLIKTGSIILFLLSFSMMFLGFYRNQWHAVRPKKFSTFQKDVEAYVIARMVLSRQSGIFSEGGLLGWGDVNPDDVNEEDYQRQYEIYLDGLSFETYWAKESNPGFQGIFFSFLDRISPFTPLNNLRLFRMFTSGLFAAILAVLILWFYGEFGWLSALFVLVSILSSQWMTLFGRNLFFVSGVFYVPMVVLLFSLRGETNENQLSTSRLFWLAFIFILLKCLFNGYDFILPTLGMSASPIVYYGVLRKWDRKIFITRFLVIVFASLAALMASFAVLSIQVAFASGSFQNGIDVIVETINRRTVSSDPGLPSIYDEAARASYWSVLKIYLEESYFFKAYVPYFAMFIVFGVISGVYWLTGAKKSQKASSSLEGYALIVTTWFSFLAPLSWYIIFKSLAYFHTHMNYLPWHMPFTLFGFGLCGYVIETILNRSTGRDRSF